MEAVVKFFAFFAIGIVCGNFITTFYFRLPRGMPINGMELPPMCDACHMRIPSPYYFPIIGLILNGGKCLGCGFIIPKIYLFIEASYGLACAFFFELHSFSVGSVLQFFLFFAVLTSAILYLNYAKFYEKANWIIATLSLSFAAQGGNLPVEGFFCGIIAALCLLQSGRVFGSSKTEIEDLCFLLALSLFLPPILFAPFALVFTVLFQFICTRRFSGLALALPVFFANV